MRAVIDGKVIAESNETVVVEGNHYFPPDSVNREYLSDTDHTTVCGWKGTASYYSLNVNGKTLNNVAWYYPEPKDAVAEIVNYVAFYPQVTVEE